MTKWLGGERRTKDLVKTVFLEAQREGEDSFLGEKPESKNHWFQLLLKLQRYISEPYEHYIFIKKTFYAYLIKKLKMSL
jgi:hypothetical protein